MCSQWGQKVQEEGENCLTDGYTLCGASRLLHKQRAVWIEGESEWPKRWLRPQQVLLNYGQLVVHISFRSCGPWRSCVCAPWCLPICPNPGSMLGAGL